MEETGIVGRLEGFAGVPSLQLHDDLVAIDDSAVGNGTPGVTRQLLYLHIDNRAALLVELSRVLERRSADATAAGFT